jgi:hypothetical protein
MRPGIGRGGRGDPVDVLTRGGRQRNRLDTAAGTGSSRAAATMAQELGGAGRRRRRSRAAARARAGRLGLPFMGARGARLPRDGGGAGLLG